jgi:hypothetical protein
VAVVVDLNPTACLNRPVVMRTVPGRPRTWPDSAGRKRMTPMSRLPSMYWVTMGELHMFAASTALSLGGPRRALEFFDLAVSGQDPCDAEQEARGTAIYLSRRAEAHCPGLQHAHRVARSPRRAQARTCGERLPRPDGLTWQFHFLCTDQRDLTITPYHSAYLNRYAQ